jgi:polyhydroxyalkanoate synthesis regulator phasin
MSVDQHQQALLESYNGSTDPLVQEAAQTANQYTEMYKSGQISKDEYTQAMQDIVRTNNINKNVDNQQVMEYMNTAITGLISLASLA